MTSLRGGGGKRIAGTFLIPKTISSRPLTTTNMRGKSGNYDYYLRKIMNNNNNSDKTTMMTKMMPLLTTNNTTKNNNYSIRAMTTTTTASTTTTTTKTAAKAAAAAVASSNNSNNNNGDDDVGLSSSGKIFFGGLCFGTFLLGCWQIQRLYEKWDKIDIRKDELKMDPTNDWSSTKNPYRRRVVRGTFLYDKEVLVGPRGAPPGVQLPRRGLSSNNKNNTNSSSSSGGMAPGPQGYYVLTPLKVSIKKPCGTHKKERLLWINRGWVPKTMVDNKSGTATKLLLDWNRPKGNVTVMTILSELEKPKLITPEHDYSKKPLQLFWLDETALKAISEEETPADDIDDDDDDDEPVIYMTQVVTTAATTNNNNNNNNTQDDADDIINNNNEKTQSSQSQPQQKQQFPLVPPVDAMAEFKTSPMIHIGYATTWYGLSAAGVYMTRKLITRGRG